MKEILKFINSFNYAVQGILATLKTERNMKFHYCAALVVLIISLFANLTTIEYILIMLSVTLVVSLELINTAIEKTIDLITKDFHPLAKYVKDVSAGAVLIAAINSFVTIYWIFYDRIMNITSLALIKIKQSNENVILIILFLILILTIGGKYMDKENINYFKGGAISGHSALAFGFATYISLYSMNPTITICSIFTAFLVAESRIEGHIHTLNEVISGALLGFLVAFMICRILM